MATDCSTCPKFHTEANKWLLSSLAGLGFLIIGSPFLYSLVNSLLMRLGLTTASPGGCPTTVGLFIHAVVYVLLFRVGFLICSYVRS